MQFDQRLNPAVQVLMVPDPLFDQQTAFGLGPTPAAPGFVAADIDVGLLAASLGRAFLS